MIAARDTTTAADFLNEPAFGSLKRTVIERIGLQYYEDKDTSLAERAEKRRSLIGCSRTEYLRRVLDPANGDELAALVDEITIGETYFFRYPAQFDALRDTVLPERLAARRAERRLRVWCAGCSSGAEPYSVAITLRQHFADLIAGWDVSILGTDINRKALAQARQGVYTDWELRDATPALKNTCFRLDDGGRWHLNAEYRSFVQFQHQNLVSDLEALARSRPGSFDVIFCRNVMIYFSTATMRRLVRLMGECLADGGWLFVGHAEPYFEIASLLAPARLDGVTLYRKAAASAVPSARPVFPPMEYAVFPEIAEADHLEPPRRREPPIQAVVAPPAIPRQAPVPSSPVDDIRRRADAGEWPQALEACARALRQNPMDIAVHYMQGLIHEQMGAPAVAGACFTRAIYLDRGFALAHFHAGLCHVRLADHRAARKSLSNVLRVLDAVDADSAVRMGEGLSARELRALAHIQLTKLPEA